MKRLKTVLIMLMVMCMVVPLVSADLALAKRSMTITWWTQDWWQGVTGQEMKGMSLDDPRRAEYTGYDWPNKIIKEFQQLHPELDLNIEVELLDWTTGYRKLDIAAAAGYPPDIMVSTTATALKFATYGMLEPFDPYLTEEDIEDYSLFLKLGEVDGKHYLLPWASGGRTMLANKKIFEETGTVNLLPGGANNLDRLWTYEDFAIAAQKNTFTRSNGEKVYGFGTYFAGELAPEHNELPFLWGYGARVFDDAGKRVILNSEEGVKGLQFLVDMEYKYKAMPPGSVGLRGQDIQDMWNAGQVSMIMGNTGSEFALAKGLDEGTIKPGVIEIYPLMFPSDLPEHMPAVFVATDAPMMFKQTDEEKRAIVAELVIYMTNTVNQRDHVTAWGSLPGRISTLEWAKEYVWQGNAYKEYFMRVLKYGVKDAVQEHMVSIRDLLTSMFQAAQTQQMSPKEALDDFAKRANEHLEKEAERIK